MRGAARPAARRVARPLGHPVARRPVCRKWTPPAPRPPETDMAGRGGPARVTGGHGRSRRVGHGQVMGRSREGLLGPLPDGAGGADVDVEGADEAALRDLDAAAREREIEGWKGQRGREGAGEGEREGGVNE